MAWLMLVSGVRQWRFVRAAAPCWKGEVVIPLWRHALILGWQVTP